MAPPCRGARPPPPCSPPSPASEAVNEPLDCLGREPGLALDICSPTLPLPLGPVHPCCPLPGPAVSWVARPWGRQGKGSHSWRWRWGGRCLPCQELELDEGSRGCRGPEGPPGSFLPLRSGRDPLPSPLPASLRNFLLLGHKPVPPPNPGTRKSKKMT